MTVIAPDPRQISTLLELVGRCLFQYQHIEQMLKLLLPHLVRSGVDPLDHNPNVSEFWDSKNTLGQLMEKLKDGLSGDRPEVAHAYLQSVVLERNHLVHHFFENPDALIGTSDALTRTIDELRRRYENSVPLQDALVNAVTELRSGLADMLPTEDVEEARCAP